MDRPVFSLRPRILEGAANELYYRDSTGLLVPVAGTAAPGDVPTKQADGTWAYEPIPVPEGGSTEPFTTVAPPAAASWTQVNFGTSTLVDSTSSTLLLTGQGSGTAPQLRLAVRSAPATPYTVTARILLETTNGANNNFWGIAFRNSGAGTLALNRLVLLTSSQFLQVQSIKYNSASSASTSYATAQTDANVAHWLQITDNGTSRICSIYHRSAGWTTAYHTVGRTDFLTADQVGFFVQADATAGAQAVRLLSWQVA